MESTLMKRLWVIAILAFGASACVEANRPVQLLSAVPRSLDCQGVEEVALTRGSLNFNAGKSYRIGFQLFSPLTVDDEAQSPAGFYAEEIVLNYESVGPKISFTEESLPIYFVVPAGAAPGESWLELDLIGTEARKKLETAVPTYPDEMTLFVTLKVKGTLPSGKGVETNEVTYPISISRAGKCPDCQVATYADREEAPCGYPGQDAFYNTFSCIPDPLPCP
jgi:hypothetical protein